MVDKTILRPDGLPDDDLPNRPLDPARLQRYEEAYAQLAQMRVPQLLEAGNPNQKLIVVLFDGTGNDADADPLRKTNVGHVRDAIENLRKSGDKQIHFEYLAGPGTQKDRLVSLIDQATGYTYEERILEMYARVARTVADLKKANPNVEISLYEMGFSRGGVQAEGFQRLLHDIGIVDPASAVETVDAFGRKQVTFTGHLVPPGKTPQMLFLVDPVPTGVPMRYNRQLSESVVSGVYIESEDERRVKFRNDRPWPLGVSEDGRLVGVRLPGCHSDQCGGYALDGLPRKAHNLTVAHINALRDTPILEARYEPTDMRWYTVHHSHKAMLVYRIDRELVRGEPGSYFENLKPDDPRPLSIRVVPAPSQTVDVSDKNSNSPSKPTPPQEPPTEFLERHAALVRQAQQEATVAAQEQAAARQRLGIIGGGALAAATTTHDFLESLDKANQQLDLGNTRAADREVQHFAIRTAHVGAASWAGAELGAELGATRYGLAGAIGGGVIGGVMGAAMTERIMRYEDSVKIFTQPDGRDQVWAFNGSQWISKAPADLDQDGQYRPVTQPLSAGPELERELNLRATATAVELGLGKMAAPVDPLSQPLNDSERGPDAKSNWEYNPVAQQWQRHIGHFAERGLSSDTVIPASPERATELDKAALAVMQANDHVAPWRLAARFAEHAKGENQERLGVPTPEAVRAALDHDGPLRASDDRIYSRNTDGKWTRTDGDSVLAGSPKIQVELDAAAQLRDLGLMDHERRLEGIQPRAPDSPLEIEAAKLRQIYAKERISPSAEVLAVVQGAVHATRRSMGLPEDTSGNSFDMLRDASGEYSIESPIRHLHRNTEGVTVVQAVTSGAEIHMALAQDRAIRKETLQLQPSHSSGLSAPLPDTGESLQTRAPSAVAPQHTPPETAPGSLNAPASQPPQYAETIEKMRDLHQRHGLPTDAHTVERGTMAVLAQCAKLGIERPDRLEFSVDRATGRPDPSGNIIAWQGDYRDPAAIRCAIPSEARAVGMEISQQTFTTNRQQFEEQQSQSLSQWTAQQNALNAQQPQARVH